MSFRYEAKGPKFHSGGVRWYNVKVHEYDADRTIDVYWIRVWPPEDRDLTWMVRRAKKLEATKLLDHNYESCAAPEGLLPYIVWAISEARSGSGLGKPPGKAVPFGVWKDGVGISAEGKTARAWVWELMQQGQPFGRYAPVDEADDPGGDGFWVLDDGWHEADYRAAVQSDDPDLLTAYERELRTNQSDFSLDEITEAIVYCVHRRRREQGTDDVD